MSKLLDVDLDNIEGAAGIIPGTGIPFVHPADTLRLVAEVRGLRAAIRLHRDQRGDDRCWLDDEALYAILPEGHVPPERDTQVELERCRQYIECRRNPKTQYVSPQRRIEELEEEFFCIRSSAEATEDAGSFVLWLLEFLEGHGHG